MLVAPIKDGVADETTSEVLELLTNDSVAENAEDVKAKISGLEMAPIGVVLE